MATQTGMSGIDVHSMLFELKSCLPLWIGKVYQYNGSTFGFKFNGDDRQKFSFLVECGRRAHLTENLPPSPPSPSGYSMFLRKYLSGGRILDISQYGLQRILDFTIGKTEKRYHLIFELFDEGNAVLCDEEYIIINPLKNHRFKDRKIFPGELYVFPGESLKDLTEEKLREILSSSEKDLVRTIASDLMTGGKYAEEICKRADSDKLISSDKADPKVILDAYNEIIHESEEGINAVITKSGCWPFLLSDEEKLNDFESYNKALELFYPALKETAESKKSAKGNKLQGLSKSEIIRNRQKQAIIGFDAKVEDLQKKVNSIYANYQLLSNIIEVLDKASKSHSWQDIEKILKESDSPSTKNILRVYPQDSSVDINLDENRIRIYVHESLESNANRYYNEIKKYKKKKTGALAAMERFVEKEPPKKKKEFVFLKPKWYHRFRWFFTSDGVLVIGGRDAGTNEEIVKKYLEGNDRFAHADVHGGSVVIIKGDTECMDEVAQFAASYSNIWKAGHFEGDVYVANREQVSKTAESGEYVARGAFVIRGERKYFRDVPLGVAIGLQYEPSLGVIGGPVSAVKKRAKYYVELKPGTYESNDAAKKVLKAIKEKIPADEQKSLKKILNTEGIAAFIPPGGSDIIEE
ncbi:fibronectin-binding domain-containing protein [Methanoplanus sp. FWC-SCC4]|uniref:Fibronectin-binding domain-containing protein n=1 Tax=Methanochimaera problematica TaxID=2609417 RepID=A0AA97FDS8_9EURY|nr:ribosome rescue protein RqcH [Methanoplanus sp. FWC-SCC4]WOF15606.1 fibronectin-binding domain-containing protein [Methanoplanus sp. FWC-SCC4]